MTNQPEDTEKVYCNNCEWKGTVSQLGTEMFETRDLASRLEPGEEVPAGECPECGALCYLEDPPEHTAAGQLKKLNDEQANGPVNIMIKRFVSAGELGDVSEIGSTEVLLQRLGEILDNSHIGEVFGTPIYETDDGKFFVVSLEGTLTEVDSSFAANFGKVEEEEDE